MTKEKEMLRETKRNKGFVLGIVAGSVLGAVAALLLAPKSGRELRMDISNKKNELMDEAGRAYDNVKERAAGIISDARSKAQNLIEEGKKRFETIKHSQEDLVYQGKERLEEGFDKVKTAVKSGVEAYNDERKNLKKEDKKNSNDNGDSDRKSKSSNLL